jgi:hypothetical protein
MYVNVSCNQKESCFINIRWVRHVLWWNVVFLVNRKLRIVIIDRPPNLPFDCDYV